MGNRQHIKYIPNNHKSSGDEFFFFQYRDDNDNFLFEDPISKRGLINAIKTYQLETVNSFYKKKRSNQTLHTLYALQIDIDGDKWSLPVSHIDILRKWDDLGFPDQPSEIRRTSEGRFHVIFRIKPARAFPDKISYWKKCALGLHKAYEDLGSDEVATTNIVGFVRVSGHQNRKYPGKQLVETVLESDSIFTLTEIHEALLENGLVRNSTLVCGSVHEKIAILENGVPPGIGNYVCFTLAIYYRDQGLTEDEALYRLNSWNEELLQADPHYKVKNTVKSAYRNGYGLSIPRLNKWVEITQGYTPSQDPPKPKTPWSSRQKINEYAGWIREHIESNGYSLNISQRKLSKTLNIPFRSFSHAILKIPGLTVRSKGKGRNASTEFVLKKRPSDIRLVYSKPENELKEMTQINDAKGVCITEE